MARFVASQDSLGTDESTWLSGPLLSGLPPVLLAPADDVVVVAPHPDDEVLGTAGLLQVLGAAGADVEVWAVTDGEGSHPELPADAVRQARARESLAALSRLALPRFTRRRLGLADGGVPDAEEELTSLLADRLHAGSLCLAPWEEDGHPDHDACGRAARTASATRGARLLRYLVWTWHWAEPGSTELPWSRCRRLDLCPAQVERKRWALAAFASQIRPFGPSSPPPVLPAPVLQRFRRSFEVYIT